MSLEGRTIALVEDDPIMGESPRRPPVARRRQGALVADAAGPPETCRRRLPDLVVCDIRLPDGTARTSFGPRPLPGRPPFLFVTGFGDIDQAVRLMRSGAGDYVTKPFEMAEFLAASRQLLRPGPQSGRPCSASPRRCTRSRGLLRRMAR